MRRERRWPRAAIPFAVLIAIWAGILMAHAIEEPDLDEPGTLSPTGTGAHGSSRLAELLAARGVAVQRVTSSAEARLAAAAAASTIFVPTPDYLEPRFLDEIARTGVGRRIVVVQPGLRSILFADLPVFVQAGRWATATGPPDCAGSVAGAGTAAALDATYELDNYYGDSEVSMNCYHGSVVGVRRSTSETVFVGANDPFRNDRIDEVGNAELALELLGEHERVIWVDVHSAEPLPALNRPSLSLPQYRRGNQDRTNTGIGVIDAFPSWLWAGVLLALVAASLLAVARARRLGPPVAEPLPVVVPASEAVTGRGRLYQRIAAREATLDTLRAAAIARLTPVVNPFGATTSGDTRLVAQVAQHTGSSEEAVRAALYGTPPADDAGLAQAVANLDALVTAVLTGPAGGPNPPDPNAADPNALEQFRGGNP